MPELVANGPVIPSRLMNELDSERAVFFCGAGISMGPASKLPNFVDLVKHIYQVHRLKPDDVEREALDLGENESIENLGAKNANRRRRPNHDKALGLLERDKRLGPGALRRSVIDRLSKRRTGPLVVHEALLRLSRTEKGVRLITTNFDNRFDSAGRSQKEKLVIDNAPKLPVPKPHDWSSIVHLHGRILSRNDDGSNLVLTAADFGRAYLTERWAARFITELFREFTVVFVGYSLDDPVMGYMVDALAAERAKGATLKIAYAFAEYDGAGGFSEQKIRDAWLAKNVEPIPYDSKDDHKLLRNTLVEWARVKTDPYRTREQIVLDGISKIPSGPDDPVAERVTWALENSVIAEALAKAPPTSNEREFPKLERWLDIFAKAGLLSQLIKSEGETGIDQGNSTTSLVGSDAQTRNPPVLGKVTRYLALWIARHLHIPQILGWVLRKGGHLHPFLRDKIRYRLAEPEVKIPEKLRHLWTVLAYSASTDHQKLLCISEQINRATSEFERHRLEEQAIRSIAPRLIVRSGPSPLLELERALSKKPQPIEPIDTCGHLELLVCDRHESYEIEQILKDKGILARNAETLTGYLEHSITLLNEVEKSSSIFYRPSIAAHTQNRFKDDWTLLIDLVRDSYFALLATHSGRARARNLLERWILSGQPLFRRLALHALTDDPKSDIRLAGKLLVAGRKPGLWEIELHREVLRFLRRSGSRLPRNLRTGIVRAIHAGPKSKSMKSESIHRKKVLCLSRLLHAGAKLDKKSKMLAEKGIPPNERDEFLVGGGGHPREPAPRDLLAGTVADVVNELSIDAVKPAQFEVLTLRKPVKVASALRRLAEREEWPLDFWERYLWHIETLRHQKKLRRKLQEYIACVLNQAPDELFAEIGSAVAGFVKGIAEDFNIAQETSFKTLWNKARKGVIHGVGTGFEDPIMEAWGDVAGKLAEAALTRLWKYDPKPDAGLPEAVHSYFERIIADENGHLGHVILATNLYQLFTTDPEWTRKYLIPLLDQSDSNATRDIWAGYAWSPNIGPNLRSVLKESFLKVLTTFDTLRSMEENLVHLFIEICLEAPNQLSDKEIHRVVGSLSEEALESCLKALTYRLHGEPAERAQAWCNKVKPWLAKYWPKAAGHNSTRTSEAIVDMLIKCGDAFPYAVSWALNYPYLKPIKGSYLNKLRSSNHLKRHSSHVLQLLGAIVEEGILENGDKPCLREILDSLKNEVPELSQKLEYLSLYKIAISD